MAGDQDDDIKPELPVGSKGTLLGDKWEVKGFLRKCDSTGDYFWSEYLLTNPTKGYRWLVQNQGHWTFYEMIKGKPDNPNGRAPVWDGHSFSLYLRDTAKVVQVQGDFYWKVKVGEKADVADYICPPYILSKEESSSETVWSYGQYLEPSVVGDAFQIKNDLPPRIGVGPCQPSTMGSLAKPMTLWGLLFSAVLLGLHLYASSINQGKNVFSQNFFYAANDPEKIKVTSKFQLDGDMANVQVISTADISNSWADLDLTLVNDVTGQKFVFNEGMEYYFGSDSDGPWTEGDRTHDVILPAVPGGTYYLTIQPTLAPGVVAQNFGLSVNRDVLLFSNFMFCFCLLLLFPMVVAFWGYRTEVSRWADSDYSPYKSKDDD